MNSLLTNSEFRLRGVSALLMNNLCFLCVSFEESSRHLIFSCVFFGSVWRVVFCWLRMVTVEAFEVCGLVDALFILSYILFFGC